MKFGLDEENEKNEMEENEAAESERKKRPAFAYWTVGGTDYKLKLNTAMICKLEGQFKKNLMDILTAGGIPPLAVMLTIIQGAMQPWHHKVKFKNVQEMFDQYCEEGGTQLTLMTDVLMPVYNVSGFFSESQQEDMEDKVKEAKEAM